MGNLAQLQSNSQANSPLLGKPLGFLANFGDVGQAVNLDETTLFGTGATGAYADLLMTGLTVPATPVVTTVGTVGSQTWSYVLADISNVGSAPSTAGTVATGNATLTTTNYNVIAMSVTPGHSYNLYRSVSGGTPSSTGLLSSFVAGSAQTIATYNDIGLGATTADIPTDNTTGAASFTGPVFNATNVPGGVSGIGGKVTVSSATGVTLTAAQFLADVLVRTTGSGGISDATPTAAALVSQIPGVRAGSMHRLLYRNEGTGLQTITAGSGVTLRAGDTSSIATVAVREFWIVFTTITPGSEAVEVITGATGTY